MANLDEFESLFRAAAKHRYSHVPSSIQNVLVFTDIGDEPSRRLTRDIDEFISELGDGINWSHAGKEDYTYIDELLAIVEERKPDLICAYRNLHGRARKFPFSLGSHVDVLTQATSTPVLLLPSPTEEGRLPNHLQETKRVMVLTDHITGSDRLVSYGVRFTEPKGDLYLTHLEDDVTFERYIDVISKLPSIDTDAARRDIRAQLLKEPSDYIDSCIEALSKERLTMKVHKQVEMGHRVSHCRQLIEQNSVDLVVMNTKDDEQLAMHGLAYPLAVELRKVPLLLL